MMKQKTVIYGQKTASLLLSLLFVFTTLAPSFALAEETENPVAVLQNDLNNWFDYATQHLDSLDGKVKGGRVLRIGTGSRVADAGEIWQNPENLKEGLTIDDLYNRIDSNIPPKDLDKGFGYDINSDYIQYFLEQHEGILKDYSTYENKDDVRSAAYIIAPGGAAPSTVLLTLLELKAHAITNPNLTENDLNQVFGLTEEKIKMYRSNHSVNCLPKGLGGGTPETEEGWQAYRANFLAGFADQIRSLAYIGCDKNDNIIEFSDGTVEISKDISDRAFTLRRQLAALADSKAQYETWTSFGEGSFYQLYAQWFDFPITLFSEQQAEIIEPPAIDFLKSAYYKNDNCGVASYFDHSFPSYGEDNFTVIFTGKKLSSNSNVIGYNSYDGHNGVDYHVRDCSKSGTALENGKPIYAAADGVVLVSQEDLYTGLKKGYGNYVVIEHDVNNDGHFDYMTRYAHLQDKSTLVANQTVNAGTLMGIAGNTGNSDGTHLHFHVQKIVYEKIGDEWKRIIGQKEQIIHSYITESIIDPFGWWGTEDEEVVNEIGEVKADPWQKNQPYLSSNWLWKTSDKVDDSDDAFFAFNTQPYPWQKESGTETELDSAIYTFGTFEPTKKWENWGFWGGKVGEAGRYNVEVHIPDLIPKYVSKSRIDKLDLTAEQKNTIWEFNLTNPENAYEKTNYKAKFKVPNLAELENLSFWSDLTQVQKDAVLDMWNNRVSREARYFVYHNGNKTEVVIDPTQIDSTGWVSLGNYDFNTGTNQAAVQLIDEVQTSENASKIIWADAVRWTPVNMPKISITLDGQEIQHYAPNEITNANKVDFGQVDLGDSSELEFTLKNTGGVDLQISNAVILPIELDGNYELSITKMPDTVVAGSGGITTFKVKYTPQANGGLSEYARLNLNFANEGLSNFSIYFKGGNGAFYDVQNEDWFRRYVRYVTEQGVVEGYDGNLFKPEQHTTRAETLKMAYAGKKLDPSIITGEPVFVDVNDGDWYYKFAKDAKDKGYIQGTNECRDDQNNLICQATAEQNCFCPNEDITRYEAAKIVHAVFTDTDYRTEDGLCENSVNDFTDVNRLNWYCEATHWLKNNEAKWQDSKWDFFSDKQTLANGYQNGTFGKSDGTEINKINRAEMAKVIANAMNFSGQTQILPMTLQDGAMTLQADSSALVSIGENYEQVIDETNANAPAEMHLPLSDQKTIKTNETLDLNFETQDADGDEMFYFWNATGGSFTPIDNTKFSHISWTPPQVSTPTTFVITAMRGDGRGKIGEGRFEVMVEPMILLTPTIHAKATGGNWNSASTWVENRLPNASDIVEINGTVIINTDTPSVGGLLIKKDAILQNSVKSNLSIQGYLVNQGTVSDSGDELGLVLNLSGDLMNSGKFENKEIRQFADLKILNTTTIESRWNCNDFALTVDAPVEVTFSRVLDGRYPGEILEVNYYTFNGSGTIIAQKGKTALVRGNLAEFRIEGNGEEIDLSGNIQLPKTILAGTSPIRVGSSEIEGDLLIATGAVLSLTSLGVHGEFVNFGILQNSSASPYFYLESHSILVNHGTIRTMAENSEFYLIGQKLLNNGVIQNDFANTLMLIAMQEKLQNFGTIAKNHPEAMLQVGVGSELENQGIWQISELILDGENPKKITSSQNLEQLQVTTESDLELEGNFTLGGKLLLNNYALTVNSPSFVILEGVETDSSDLYGAGKIKITENVHGQFWGEDLTELILEGDALEVSAFFGLSRVVVEADSEINIRNFFYVIGALEIGTNAKITNIDNAYLIVFKDLKNYGQIQQDVNNGSLTVGFFENVLNRGVWDATQTILAFDAIGESPEIWEFQMTDTNGNWQEIEQNEGGMKFLENALLTESHYWRVRGVNEGVAGDWSESKTINNGLSPNKVKMEITDADGNPISGAQFSQDNGTTWQNFPAVINRPNLAQSYKIKWKDYNFLQLLRIEPENAYRIDLVKGVINSQSSPITQATFMLDKTNVTARLVDQNYTEIPGSAVGITGITSMQPTGTTYELVNGKERQFTFSWRNEFYQPKITFEKGKINRFENGVLQKLDSPDGTTQVQFVLPTLTVSVHTLNQFGQELTDGQFSVHSLGSTKMNSGTSFLMANGGRTIFYGTWKKNTTSTSYLQILKGKLYQIDTKTNAVTTSVIGGENARVEFVYEVIPVVVKNVNQAGSPIGGSVKITSDFNIYYPSGKTYQLANGTKESFTGSYGGAMIYNSGFYPLTIEKGKTYRINTSNDRDIQITNSADGATYVELEFPVIEVTVRTVDQYGNQKGGGQFKFDNVWYNTGYKFLMPNGTQKFFNARFDNTSNSVYKSLNVYAGKLHSIDSVTNVLTVTNSPDGQTRVEFVFPVVNVKVSSLDQNAQHVQISRGTIGSYINWEGSPSNFILQKNSTNKFYALWPFKTAISANVTLEEGKIYTLTTTGSTVTSTGGVLSEVRFVFPYVQ